jgi:hypothetical protein
MGYVVLCVADVSAGPGSLDRLLIKLSPPSDPSIPTLNTQVRRFIAKIYVNCMRFRSIESFL